MALHIANPKVVAKLERLARPTGLDEVEGTNRVAYDLTSKPPGTIGWE